MPFYVPEIGGSAGWGEARRVVPQEDRSLITCHILHCLVGALRLNLSYHFIPDPTRAHDQPLVQQLQLASTLIGFHARTGTGDHCKHGADIKHCAFTISQYKTFHDAYDIVIELNYSFMVIRNNNIRYCGQKYVSFGINCKQNWANNIYKVKTSFYSTSFFRMNHFRSSFYLLLLIIKTCSTPLWVTCTKRKVPNWNSHIFIQLS